MEAEELVQFTDINDLEDTWYVDGSDEDGGVEETGHWELGDSLREFDSGFVLNRVAHTTSSDTAYIVTAFTGEEVYAITPAAELVEHPADATIDDIQRFETDSAAIEAHDDWYDDNDAPDANGDGDSDDDGEEWTGWEDLMQRGPWHVKVRSNVETEEDQIIVATRTEDGTHYLHPDGTPSREAHVYDALSAAEAALDSWETRDEAGETTGEPDYTGDAPDDTELDREVESSSTGLVDSLTSPIGLLAIGVVVLAALIVMRSRGGGSGGASVNAGGGTS